MLFINLASEWADRDVTFIPNEPEMKFSLLIMVYLKHSQQARAPYNDRALIQPYLL
jgi:hypothetical protein